MVWSKDTYICPIRNATFVEFCRSHKNETFCIKSYLGSVRLYTMIFPSHNIQFYWFLLNHMYISFMKIKSLTSTSPDQHWNHGVLYDKLSGRLPCQNEPPVRWIWSCPFADSILVVCSHDKKWLWWVISIVGHTALHFSLFGHSIEFANLGNKTPHDPRHIIYQINQKG